MVAYHDGDEPLDLGQHTIAVVLRSLSQQLGERGRLGEAVHRCGPHLEVAALLDKGCTDLAGIVTSILDGGRRGPEELEQLLDAATRQTLAEEQAAGHRIRADDITLLMG